MKAEVQAPYSCGTRILLPVGTIGHGLGSQNAASLVTRVAE